MEEVDYNKILEELLESRKNRKSLVTCIAPQGYAGSLVSGDGSQGIHPLNFDFASLYPRTMSMTFTGPKNLKRKKKIRNIFPDIE